jgi:hypothetical protein
MSHEFENTGRFGTWTLAASEGRLPLTHPGRGPALQRRDVSKNVAPRCCHILAAMDRENIAWHSISLHRTPLAG